ncbi:MAG: Rho termination factor N-terminal domain-containing protein, partial [Clostridium sp.]
MTKDIYEKMTLAKLKEEAKGLEIKNISKYKKNELIEVIIEKLKENEEKTANTIKKDGVVLTEKISPKAHSRETNNRENNNRENNIDRNNNG